MKNFFQCRGFFSGQVPPNSEAVGSNHTMKKTQNFLALHVQKSWERLNKTGLCLVLKSVMRGGKEKFSEGGETERDGEK